MQLREISQLCMAQHRLQFTILTKYVHSGSSVNNAKRKPKFSILGFLS